ncbi:hypothetical protein F5X96DRAFT_665647 [Biscogniauxia mediterranea]|nr:hypothetical protein F5X96DRAFT_665647 [Biscogniauxia mediterranea]
MESLLKRAAAFPNWTQTPFPGLQLSPSGLLALADLGTIAQRTRIVGGSSWLDALLLAPGLHYQQAADAISGDGGSSSSSSGVYNAVELTAGKMSTYNIVNTATLRYLERVGGLPGGQRIIVDVGMIPTRRGGYLSRVKGSKSGGGGDRGGGGGRSRRSVDVGDGRRATIYSDAELGWLSHVLYLASPVLTVLAFVFMILLREWWGVASLLALMFSRVLNIWVIKQRTKEPPPPPSTSRPGAHPPDGGDADADPGELLTEYLVDLGNGRTVCLRGTAADLQAITTTAWLSAKTHVEGYLEAAAKLTVYLVAAFSANMTQVGSIIFLALLLVTAGLLGLSNAHAKSFRMHGRLAAPTLENLPDNSGGGGGGGTRGEKRGGRGEVGAGSGSGIGNRRGRGRGPGVISPPPPQQQHTYPYPRTQYPGYPDSEAGSCSADSSSWPAASDERETPSSGGLPGTNDDGDDDDSAERGQVGRAARDRHPFDARMEYR